MLYRIKSQPEDFVVHEILGKQLQETFLPDGFLYIHFEKKGKNTMDVILQLCKSMGLIKKHLGVAGLKDKQAVTRQRISLPSSAVDMVGGSEEVVKLFELQGVQVIETKRGHEALRVGDNQANDFWLTIRAQQQIDSSIKKTITDSLERLATYGFPNYYGMQRFGKGCRNFHRAERIIDHDEFTKGEYVSKFILQSYQNFYFNRYTHNRWLKQEYLLIGDILVDGRHHSQTKLAYYLGDNKIAVIDREDYLARQYDAPFHHIDEFVSEVRDFAPHWQATGPLLGTGLLLPPKDSPAYLAEQIIYSDLNFRDKKIQNCQYFGMSAKRRTLWAKAQNFHYERLAEKDLLLSFRLATGSYATVLVSTLFDNLDEQTIIGNKLKIPW